MKKLYYRINQSIRSEKVRLIEKEENVILPLKEALSRAQERGLDLVEVAAKPKPPVVKILDFKKFLFAQKKKRQLVKKARSGGVKELRFGPRIGERDLQIRIEKGKKFLKEGSQVKLTVFFRGREASHPEIGEEKLKRFIKGLEDFGKQEGGFKKIGKLLVARVVPR